MFKIARYYKRYAAFVLVGVVLLFCQALLELNLPNKMSDIVNVGIQRGGIEDKAPQAVSVGSYTLLSMFMTDEQDFAGLEGAYRFYNELTPEKQLEVSKKFPEGAAQNVLVLVAEGEEKQRADNIMLRAEYAMVDLMRKAAEQRGADIGAADGSQANLDPAMMQQMMGMLGQLPESAFQSAAEAARQMPDATLQTVSSVVNKAFYRELGADTDKIQTTYILRTGGFMVLLAVLVVVCAVVVSYCFARFGGGVARDLRRDVFAKVSAFSNNEIDKFSTSSLITRTTNDVTQVQMMCAMGMRMLVFAPVMGIGGVIMALRKSVGMSWILAVAVGVVLLSIGLLLVFVMPRFKKMQQLLDRLNLVARENLTGIMVVRAFSNQKFQQKRFEKANADYTENSLVIGRGMVTMFPIMMLVMNLTAVFIIWFGAKQIAQSTIQVGDIMAFIQYAMQVIMSFIFITMIFVMLPRAAVSAERIDEVLRTEISIKDPAQPQHFSGTVKGEVRFDNVSFKYDGADEDVISNVSFTAKPGQTTAFIGATGSGKSTLINLIPRFYDVTSGSVTIDGLDVRSLPQIELRRQIGYVPQKGLLFSGDIAGNLRVGSPDATANELSEAAAVAQADAFISTMEDGYSAAVSQGGTNVSGGQRQRLSIARALVKKPPVYIFDDSFSALDFKTDAKLRAALKAYTGHATVLIVAQRVSTIMNAEQIVVMEHGRVAGIGTHRQLLESCAAYREIAESQLSKEELA